MENLSQIKKIVEQNLNYCLKEKTQKKKLNIKVLNISVRGTRLRLSQIKEQSLQQQRRDRKSPGHSYKK